MPNRFCVASAVFRLFVCGLAVLTWFLGMTEPRSMISQVAQFPDGQVVLWLMLVCGLIGLFDVWANDMKRGPIRMESTRTYRHFGFSALAFCYAALVLVAHLKLQSIGLSAYYLWNALLVVTFALIDAHQRSKELSCRQVCN